MKKKTGILKKAVNKATIKVHFIIDMRNEFRRKSLNKLKKTLI